MNVYIPSSFSLREIPIVLLLFKGNSEESAFKKTQGGIKQTFSSFDNETAKREFISVRDTLCSLCQQSPASDNAGGPRWCLQDLCVCGLPLPRGLVGTGGAQEAAMLEAARGPRALQASR